MNRNSGMVRPFSTLGMKVDAMSFFNAVSILKTHAICSYVRCYSNSKGQEDRKNKHQELLPLIRSFLMALNCEQLNLNRGVLKNYKQIISFLEGFVKNLTSDLNIDRKFIILENWLFLRFLIFRA